jgi:hypothetical protein
VIDFDRLPKNITVPNWGECEFTLKHQETGWVAGYATISSGEFVIFCEDHRYETALTSLAKYLEEQDLLPKRKKLRLIPDSTNPEEINKFFIAIIGALSLMIILLLIGGF